MYMFIYNRRYGELSGSELDMLRQWEDELIRMEATR